MHQLPALRSVRFDIIPRFANRAASAAGSGMVNVINANRRLENFVAALFASPSVGSFRRGTLL